MESWEYVPVGNQPQFNYDVRSSYQKIITSGGGGRGGGGVGGGGESYVVMSPF